MDVESKTVARFQEAHYKMNLMRCHGTFCDITLVTEDMKISAHKIILAASSNFFYISIGDMGEEKYLNLNMINGKTLLALVDYIYTSHLKINLTNVQELLTAANILQLKGISEECCKYLETHLNINTSLKIFSVAQHHNYPDLLKKAESFIENNFNEIMNTREFLHISINQLTKLISRDNLEVPSEERVYEGVISWLKHDLSTRIEHLSNLMGQVRLALISRDYLAKHIIIEPLIQTNHKCKDLIINALLSNNIFEMAKPKARKCSESHQILIMGGWGKDAETTFEFYDLKTNSQSKIHHMPTDKRDCSLAVINQKIYVLSEYDITQYDLVNNRWNKSIKIDLSTSDCGVGVLNDCVYFVGGIYNENEYSSVERLHVSSQQWDSIAFMSTGRYSPGIGVLNGLLYAVGGRTSLFDALNSVEYYNPKLNIWIRTSDLITGRYAAAVGILHNKMYVIGGCDGNTDLNSVECFSPETNEFTQSALLNIPRRYSSVVQFDNKLYVIGGWNESGALNTIEVYCPKIDKWQLLPTPINIRRYGHGALIVERTFQS